MKKVRNVRIVKETRGKYNYYRAEVQKTWFFGQFKYWVPMWASENRGHVYYGDCNWDKDIRTLERYIKVYSDLTGEDIRYDEPMPQ
jgi:hypothetical protein